MKRKDWILVIGTLFLIVFLDHLSKQWASNMPEQWHGILHLILIHNHGAMLGLFSELPAVLRIVTLSTSGVFLLSIYAIIQYLIPTRLMTLRMPTSSFASISFLYQLRRGKNHQLAAFSPSPPTYSNTRISLRGRRYTPT